MPSLPWAGRAADPRLQLKEARVPCAEKLGLRAPSDLPYSVICIRITMHIPGSVQGRRNPRSPRTAWMPRNLQSDGRLAPSQVAR